MDFLKLSTYSAVFMSGDPSIESHVKSLCDRPKLILKRLRKDKKFPSIWCTKWSATFILAVTELIKEDLELVRKSTASTGTRKSHRTQSSISFTLPAAANQLLVMVNKARLKVQKESMTVGGKKRKSNKPKSVQDFMVKRGTHEGDYKVVTKDDIKSKLLCPLCNHCSLISLTSKKEVDEANKNTRLNYKGKVAEWTARGKTGNKSRMGKTELQILGCVCYT